MILTRKLLAVIIAFFQTFFINIGLDRAEMKSTDVSPITIEETDFSVTDKTETDLYKTVEYASSMKNAVECVYTDSVRSAYTMKNKNAVLTHKLTDVQKNATLTDGKGGVYIADSFRSFYSETPGVRIYFEDSVTNARVNTIRLGEYYYDCHVRDMNVGCLKVDKEYHVYGDKMYMEYALMSDMARTVPYSFGSEISINADTVSSFCVKDKNGLHGVVGDIDAESVEFAAFDIKGVGVVGFIVPADSSTRALSVSKIGCNYIISQTADLSGYKGINKYDETGKYNDYRIAFGCRIYSDKTHSYNGIKREARNERNPLEFTVEGTNANAVAVGYETLRGTYTVKMNGTDFQYAYDNPDLRFFADISIKGDTLDRNIIFRTTSDTTGCIEGAALLDKNELLMPVDIQVCKNFKGDGGDEKYSFTDYMYSDTFTPITVEKDGETQFTILNLYQNWGKFPLKQLSSIEFHTSYYHLSTGTTESNCIAPYFVIGRDGWTLPDFRCASGKIWTGQPQFNSVGILKFMSYRDSSVKNTVYAEFTGSKINSCGQTYADVTNYYTSDNGCFNYSLRHIEFPQQDENRTYYTLNVEFTDTISFDNFKKDFDLFYFDGRFVAFNKTGYINENGERVNSDVSQQTAYHTLSAKNPYFGFYSVTDSTVNQIEKCFGCNFALIIKNSEIIMNNTVQDIPFVFREQGDSECTTGCLTLDAESLTFNKGDSINIELILLPWGVGTETTDDTVIKVREDSAVKSLRLADGSGSGYIPTVTAQNNTATVTATGGRGNNVIKVNGFTSMKAPVIEQLVNGKFTAYNTASSHGYDGYTIRTENDGTYAISFVYTVENPDAEYTFRISN